VKAFSLGLMSEEEEKQKLVQLIKAKQAYPGDFWKPNKGQWNLIKLIGGTGVHTFETDNKWTWHNCDNTDKFMNFGVMGNGAGKSALEAVCAKQFLGLGDNRYFHIDGDLNKPLYPFFRYPTGHGDGWIISNTSNIKENIVPALLEMFGNHPYEKFKDNRDFHSRFIGKNGRTLVLKTYEQDRDEFKGKTLWWAWFDEPEKRPEILQEVIARFRRGGKIIFTECPLGDAAFTFNIINGNSGWSAGTIFCDAEINCIEHGGTREDGEPCGVLHHEDLMRIFEGYRPEEREARQHAHFMHLIGLIFPTFSRDVHLVKPQEIPTTGTLLFVIDPHNRRAPAMGWFRLPEDGRTYMIEEWPRVQETIRSYGQTPLRQFYWDVDQDNRTIDDYCKVINDIEKRIGIPSIRVMDGKFAEHKYPNTGKTVIEEYRSRGISCIPAECVHTVQQGHEKIKMLLDYCQESGKIKMPRLFINENNLNTTVAFEKYSWDSKKKVGEEKPDEEFKDFMDVVRMAVNREVKYHDPEIVRQLQRVFA